MGGGGDESAGDSAKSSSKYLLNIDVGEWEGDALRLVGWATEEAALLFRLNCSASGSTSEIAEVGRRGGWGRQKEIKGTIEGEIEEVTVGEIEGEIEKSNDCEGEAEWTCVSLSYV